ncbi:MAG: hypothetical protein QW292_10730 [Candidatus Parvarchaeota archaeon]
MIVCTKNRSKKLVMQSTISPFTVIDTMPLKELSKKLNQDPISELVNYLPSSITAEELVGAMDVILPYLTSKRGRIWDDSR